MIVRVPIAASSNEDRSHIGLSVLLLRLQAAAEIASSQINTDIVTCTTSATRKKSMNGINPCTTGVRASTSRIEKMPAATNATRPKVNQPVVVARAVVLRADSP